MSNETEAPELIRAIEAIPTRTEMISGQAFRYVKLSEVLDLLDTRADLSDAKDKRIEELEAKLAKAMDGLHKARTALDDVPKYHAQAMGCGVEDRGIVDRYEAAAFGWEQSLDRVYAEHVNPAEEILRKTIAEIQGNSQDGWTND